MDPVSAIGLAASAEQLAGLATTILGNMYLYYQAVRDAPKRSKELRQEMSAVCDQLDSLTGFLTSDSATLKVPASLTKSIAEFDEMLKEMNDRVKASNAKGLKRLKWPFKKYENKHYLDRIQRYRLILDTALNLQSAYCPVIIS
jgi:hypothetical protein